MKLFTIPNLFTLGNLLCGCLAIVFAFEGNLVWSAYLVGIACVFDFLDGFLARVLKVDSPIGKQLDSLADMVTFGVVPGVVMFKLLSVAVMIEIPHGNASLFPHPNQFGSLWLQENQQQQNVLTNFLPYIAFLIPLFSALRLAKFNVDTRQSDSFIGVPTPANSILICSLPLILRFSGLFVSDWPQDIGGAPTTGYESDMFVAFIQTGGRMGNFQYMNFIEWLLLNPWFLIGLTVVLSFLLIAELPLFALKFKSFKWKGNEVRYVFLLLSVAMLVLLKFLALPLVILLYVGMSVGMNVFAKGK